MIKWISLEKVILYKEILHLITQQTERAYINDLDLAWKTVGSH